MPSTQQKKKQPAAKTGSGTVKSRGKTASSAKTSSRSDTKKPVRSENVPAEQIALPREETSAPDRSSGTNPIMLQMLPFIYAVIALFLTILYFVPSAGEVGNKLKEFLFGLFSGAAFSIPVLLVIAAFLCIPDHESGTAAWKAVCYLVTFLTTTVLMHFMTGGIAPETEEFTLKDWYALGSEFRGGGAVGAPIGNFLYRSFGNILTLFLLFVLLIVFILLIFGVTPRGLCVMILCRIREARNRAAEEDSKRYERTQKSLEAANAVAQERAQRTLPATRSQTWENEEAASINRQMLDINVDLGDSAAESEEESRGKKAKKNATLDAQRADEIASTADDPVIDEKIFEEVMRQTRERQEAQGLKPREVPTVEFENGEARAPKRSSAENGKEDEAVPSAETENAAGANETTTGIAPEDVIYDADFEPETAASGDEPSGDALIEYPDGDAAQPAPAEPVGEQGSAECAPEGEDDELPFDLDPPKDGTATDETDAAPTDTPKTQEDEIAAILKEFGEDTDFGTEEKPQSESAADEDNGAEGIFAGSDEALLERLAENSPHRTKTDPSAEKSADKAETDLSEDPETADGTGSEVVMGEIVPEDEEQPREYIFPPIELLSEDRNVQDENVASELRENAARLVKTLEDFHVRTKIVDVCRGPTITRYELLPEPGTRVRSIENLVDDIALNLATTGVRIEAPIPGKSAVGIEVPNKSASTVYLRTLLETDAFAEAKSCVTAALGQDVAGNDVFLDIDKMPHLLIAGATGMGKSVCINSLIVSLLYKAKPDELKLILVDPKKVELSVYNGVPHLYMPVVSDAKKAAGALSWAVSEMERRYTLLEEVNVRNIKGYNEITKDDPEREFLPQFVIVIDELADLMMMAKTDVEESICRIAQKARAAGMHLIIGTQRPSVDVITGLIKANFPSRIAFRVSSLVDSRTIIDQAGAENLVGRGDMLYNPVGVPKPMRVQGCFVSDSEVESIVEFIKENNGGAKYDDGAIAQVEANAASIGVKKKGGAGEAGALGEDEDPLLGAAIELAVESGSIATSALQRNLSVGYGRAAKLIDRMQTLGYVSAPNGPHPREVLITREQYMEMKLRNDDV